MFTIIKNYRTLLLGFIRSEFSENVTFSTEEKADNFKENDKGSDQLKKLQAALQNGLNSEEAKQIVAEYNDIKEDAKEGLNKIATNMLENGFSVMDKTSYTSFKNLLEKGGKTVPTWDDIMLKLKDNLSVLDINFGKKIVKEKFHGITIKGDEIKVRYDGVGFKDTLKLSITDSGEISLLGWKEEDGEESNVKTGTNIDDNLLTYNIENLTQLDEIRDELSKLIGEYNGLVSKDKIEKIGLISSMSKEEVATKITKVSNKITILKQAKQIKKLEIKINNFTTVLKKKNITITGLKDTIRGLEDVSIKNTQEIKTLEKSINQLLIMVESKDVTVQKLQSKIKKIGLDKKITVQKISHTPASNKESTSNGPSLKKAEVFYKEMGVDLGNSPKIKEIQKALISNNVLDKIYINSNGDKVSNADADFGKSTFDAIKKFQANNNLTVDGMAGKTTLRALKLLNNDQEANDFYNETETETETETKTETKTVGKITITKTNDKVLNKGERKEYGTFRGKDGKDHKIFIERRDDKLNVLLAETGIINQFDINYDIKDGKITEEKIRDKIQSTIDSYFEGNNEYGLQTKLHLSEKQVTDLDGVGIDYEKVTEKDGKKYYQLDRAGLWSNDFLVSIDNSVKSFNIIDTDGKLGEGINVSKTKDLKDTLIKADKLLNLISKVETRLTPDDNEYTQDEIELKNGDITVTLENGKVVINENNKEISIVDLEKSLPALEKVLLSDSEKEEIDGLKKLGITKEEMKLFLEKTDSNFQVKGEKEFRIDRPGTNDINIKLDDGKINVTDDHDKVDIDFNNSDNNKTFKSNLEKINNLLKEFDNLSDRERKDGYEESNLDKYLNSMPKITSIKELNGVLDKTNKPAKLTDNDINGNEKTVKQQEFNKEIKARGLEDLVLSEDDMKILKKAEGVHIDLSDIEKDGDKYEIDIDGSNNLIIKNGMIHDEKGLVGKIPLGKKSFEKSVILIANALKKIDDIKSAIDDLGTTVMKSDYTSEIVLSDNDKETKENLKSLILVIAENKDADTLGDIIKLDLKKLIS